MAMIQRGFDFEREARTAAVNEACAGSNQDCSIESLCTECGVLKNLIKARLERAFLAGQMSMTGTGD